MSYQYRQLISGEWRDAANRGAWDVLNPATEEIVRTVPFGNAEDCRAAIAGAARSFRAWANATAYDRARVLKKAAELIRERVNELGHTTVLESGKPLLQGKGEWGVAADLFEWFAEEAKRAYGRWVPPRNAAKRQLVIKQPIGVVGIITAWNFPAYNVARAAAAALAAGCPIVIRPSEFTPLTAMEMVNILKEAGIPDGVVNLINGDPESMGQEMLSDPLCAKIHFTGSQRVGKILMDGASRTVKRLSLELGGNAPVLVFPDVDLDQVAASAVIAKFRNAGQVCISPQRFLVHQKVSGPFTERVTAQVSKLKLGNGLEPETNVGPMINQKQRERVEEMTSVSRAAGASVLLGGGRPADQPRGYFFEPTIVTGVTESMPLFDSEIFGPVLPIATFDDTSHAIEMANRTRHGLSAYEGWPAGNPALTVGRWASARDDTMQVRMKQQVLPPAVQHGKEADLGSQMLGIRSNGCQSLGCDTEENVVDQLLVLQSDCGDFFRHGEHNVKVRNVEEFRFAVLDPSGTSQRLAF